MAIHTYGANAVDWEQRVNLDRLREERLARLNAKLQRFPAGAGPLDVIAVGPQSLGQE